MAARPCDRTPLRVEAILPIYNEERNLPKCVEKLHEFLKERIENPWTIKVADNGSKLLVSSASGPMIMRSWPGRAFRGQLAARLRR